MDSRVSVSHFAQRYHLVRECLDDRIPLRGDILYRCHVVQVAAYDVDIFVARVEIDILGLRRPHPNEVAQAALAEVVEHRAPQSHVCLCAVVSPPEPRLAARVFVGVAGRLVQRAPDDGYALLLKQQQHVGHFRQIGLHPSILPRALFKGVSGAECRLVRGACHLAGGCRL